MPDWAPEVRRRLSSLRLSPTREREIVEELSQHLEDRYRELLDGGASPEEAERLAIADFRTENGLTDRLLPLRQAQLPASITPGAPVGHVISDLWQDMRYAVRMLRALPGFTAAAVLILALGIGATTVMFTVIEGVLLRPLPYPEPHRLVSLHARTESIGESWGVSYPDFLDANRECRSLAMAAWKYGGGTVSAPGEPEYLVAREITAELFSVLQVRLPLGRPFRAEDDRPGGAPVAIISHGLWQRRYGGRRTSIGEQLVFEGRAYTVVGVAPAGFSLDGEPDVLTPLGQDTEPRMQVREARFLHVVARLRQGVSLEEGQAEIALVARRLATQFPASDAGQEWLVRPLRTEVVGNVGPTLWLLLGAVTVVLLIACVNVASLLLARAISRERELATRIALGASRGRVIRQCLTESTVLGIVGGVFGVALAAAAIRPFVAFWPGSLPRADEIQLDWRVLVAAVVLSLLSGIAFGLAPALRVPTGSVESALRAGGRTIARGSQRLHGAFVVTELAFAVVLLASGGMLARTLLALSSLDPGLNVRNVVTARLALSPGVLGSPAQIEAAWRDVLDRVRHVPGVESAALSDIIPMRVGENSLPYSTTAVVPPPSEAPLALTSSVTPEYLKVMAIPLHAGRFIDERDILDSEAVIVVDENLALHAFGRKDVVGRQLWVPAMGRAPIRIVGVVGHVRHWGLAADDRSRVRDQMYMPFAQVPPRLLRTFSSFMSIAVRTSRPPLDIVGSLRRELRGPAADQALYEVRTMEQLVSSSLAEQRFLVVLFGIFGGVALLLACVGVYGVLAYLTNQRAPEIGVRLALGATAGDVMRLVLRQSALLIAIGIAIGLCGAWAAGRVLERFVEGMRPPEPLTLALMTSVLVAAALSASFVPARRAGRVDAMQTLRSE
jgi:putative ABC transport system permease protein